jgi:hypothetical protein
MYAVKNYFNQFYLDKYLDWSYVNYITYLSQILLSESILLDLKDI